MDKSNIHLTAGMVFVMITIYTISISCIWVTWLMPYLIVKSLTSVVDMFIMLWMVLAMISWSLWIYETEMVILFLILTLDIMSIVSWLTKEFL